MPALRRTAVKRWNNNFITLFLPERRSYYLAQLDRTINPIITVLQSEARFFWLIGNRKITWAITTLTPLALHDSGNKNSHYQLCNCVSIVSRTIRYMWTRFKRYLHYSKSLQLTPAEYVMHTAERWAIVDTQAGGGVIVMRDFNRPLARITAWASKHSMKSLGHQLLKLRNNGQQFGSFYDPLSPSRRNKNSTASRRFGQSLYLRL